MSAFVAYPNERLTLVGPAITCRPDIGSRAKREAFKEIAIKRAKSHPPFVYSKRGLLVHRIDHVDVWWYALLEDQTIRRVNQPRMVAHTVCGQRVFLSQDKARTCPVPDPNSLVCKRCDAKAKSTFGKDQPIPYDDARSMSEARKLAAARKGCIAQQAWGFK